VVYKRIDEYREAEAKAALVKAAAGHPLLIRRFND